ncbi:hypothetical protein PMAYCL1PPCAC_00045 [Pristionchus mayeri]|uniref:Uncharacterized protein n=1 Tax=Pristionchus mayeri TaxID=1317129 RepID=A0AAN4Z355_9BILA|nr:hypothetical protein PMAYCL1PPCAC_00045 [Pristionchus mayeri]
MHDLDVFIICKLINLIKFITKPHLIDLHAILMKMVNLKEVDRAPLSPDPPGLPAKLLAKLGCLTWKGWSLEDKSMRPESNLAISWALRVEESMRKNGSIEYTTRDFIITALEKMQGENGKRLMKQLEAHVGKAKTYCFLCKLFFATADRYFKHLRSYGHLIHPNASTHLYTLLVNIQKRDSAR